MKRYGGVGRPTIIVLAVGILGCSSEPQLGSESAAITEVGIHDNFDSYSGQLVPNGGWSLARPEDASPNIFPLGVDDGYDHKNVVKMINKGVQSSAVHAVAQFPSGPMDEFVFQVKVNSQVPANNSNKAALILSGDNGLVVKLFFGGLGMSMCNATTCTGFFPDDNKQPMLHIWYRIAVHLDYTTNHAVASIAPVQGADFETRNVKISDATTSEVTLSEFASVGGAVLIDNVLGYPQQ